MSVGSDANHDVIDAEARRWGAETLDLRPLTTKRTGKRGIPDLLVSYRGRMAFWEVKNPATRYGRDGLTEAQREFKARWPSTPYYVVETIADARMALGVG